MRMRGPTCRSRQDMELAEQEQAFRQIGNSQLALLKCWQAVGGGGGGAGGRAG